MEKRPEPALSLQDYKDDAKARWDVHLYEWKALVKAGKVSKDKIDTDGET